MGRKFFLVRHAESNNNAANHNDSLSTSEPDSHPAKKQKSSREPNPELSAKGEAQARAVAAYLTREYGTHADTSLRPGLLVTSPMRRALATSRPIVSDLKKVVPELQVKVLSNLHEQGGCFLGERPKTKEQEEACKAEPVYGDNVEEILTRLEAGAAVELLRFDEAGQATELPADAPGWWRGGYETAEETKVRAKHIKAWLWSLVAPDAPEASPEGAVMVVGHGLFMDFLLKELLSINAGDAVTLLSANCCFWLLEFRDQPQGRSIGVLVSNCVDGIPKEVRTGHSMRAFKACP